MQTISLWKIILNEKKDFSDGSFFVADGAYNGEKNSRLASEHNLNLLQPISQDENQMKYMLILCLQKMVNISSNAKMAVPQKNAAMILEMIVPLHIFREVNVKNVVIETDVSHVF